jgi:sulfate adenylyltransferase subunit 1 (EFTu-like GTPase family)
MDKDYEAVLERLIEIICGDKLVGVESAALAMKQDALRYRWLKEHHLQVGPDAWIRTGEDLDDAIDAAMWEKK